MKGRMTSLRASSVAVLLAALFCRPQLAAAGLDAAEELPASLAQRTPRVPEDLWNDYVKAVTALPSYAFGQAVKKEIVEPRLAEWSAKHNAHVSANYAPWMSVAVVAMDIELGQDRVAKLMQQNFPDPARGNRQRDMMLLTLAKVNMTYFVPASMLKQIDLRVLSSLKLRHPLNDPAQSIKIEESLPALVHRLLDKTNCDYVVYRTQPEAIVDLRFQNRSIAECLRLAAEASHHQVLINGRDIQQALADQSREFGSLLAGFQDRESINAEKKPGKLIETPMDLLDFSVSEMVADLRDDRVLAIQVRPKAATFNVTQVVEPSNPGGSRRGGPCPER